MPELIYQCHLCAMCYGANDLEETWCEYMEHVELYCPTKDCPGTTFWIWVQEDEEK